MNGVELSQLPVELDYEITLDDMADFAVYHHRQSRTVRRQRRQALSLTMALALLACMTGPWTLSSAMFCMTLVGLLAAFHSSSPHALREQARRAYSEGKNLGTVGRQHLVLSAMNVTRINAVSETKIRWSAVERVEVTSEHLFIYVGATSAVAVPRRAFSSDEAWARFADVARRLHVQALQSPAPPPMLPPYAST